MKNTAESVSPGWRAELELGFSCSTRRTVLQHYRHAGPLQVQRPFFPESDGTCHVYILHPPGGVVGGDELVIQAELNAGARALLTTPAAGKFYRSSGQVARQTQQLRVAAGAVLEWLPQETIVFQSARVNSAIKVDLAGDANFIGWDIVCLGRPAAGERFTDGFFRQRIEIKQDGVPRYVEQGNYTGEVLNAPWGLRGQSVIASLFCVTQQTDLLEKVRNAIAETRPDELVGVTQLDGVLLCRYLGPSTERARFLFGQAWAVIRNEVLAKPVTPPRVWST
ncbi:MAG: urease accessory protein UreD [Candidatus Competibacteraceae bacterium]|jgi:urease accessory protein|nr:urease accessory protein UreD [Candidatus Competibacteraceae bacterium]